jgi:hypothetical protein
MVNEAFGGRVQGRCQQGRAGQDGDRVDEAERGQRAGSQRIDALEETVEPEGREGLCQHDAQLHGDADTCQRLVVEQVGQGGLGVVGGEQLAPDDQ